MANDSNQKNDSTVKKGSKSNNDLEMLKLILDSDPALKKKVIRFMQKNYIKVSSQNSK